MQHRKAPDAAAVPAGADNPAATTTSHAHISPAAAVFEQLPAELRRRISKGASGRVLAAIQRELAGRSVEQLTERIGRRWAWWQHKGERVNDPVAAAVTLVRARLCANARCEDGEDLDQGGACTACGGGSRRTDTPPPSAALRTTPSAVPAPAVPQVTPTPPPLQERFAELDKLTSAPSGDEEPRPKPRKAPHGPGEAARAAIEEARAKLGPKKLSQREKDLQAAQGVYCERCGAEAGTWCVNGDGIETPGLIHSGRVVAARTGTWPTGPTGSDQRSGVA
ncbi:zinc finger domain-containing protein [Planomonospora algeriensis]